MKDLDKNLTERLQNIANQSKALLMSFIAPDRMVRKSPVSFDYATIGVNDLYKIEDVVENLRDKNKLPKNLHLIIQTPGGMLGVAIKIAKYLRMAFENIEAYIPYEAASGGTLMCLAANTIVMGTTSNLTPIDPQVKYKGQWISATSYRQAIKSYEEGEYANRSPSELPTPYQQLCNQFDPVIAKEMDKHTLEILTVAFRLLIKSQNLQNEQDRDRLTNVVVALGKTNYPHSHIISVDEAEQIGLNVSKDADKLKLLKIYKEWVSARLDEEETTHIVDLFYPQEDYEEKD